MRTLSARTQGLIAINLTALLFGTAALFGKLALSPLWIVGMRAAFASATLLICTWTGPARPLGRVPRELWRPLIASGVIIAVHWVTFFAVVQLGGVAIATLTFATFPLFTLLMEAWRARRRPRLVELVAGATIVLAVSLLAPPASGAATLSAVVLGIGCALAYAAFWHMSSALSARLPAVTICFYQSVIVALLVLPTLPLVSRGPREPLQWLWLVWFGVVNTALVPLIYLYALRRLSPSTCSGFVALEPVYAIAFAAWLFHDSVPAATVLSGLLIVTASYVLLRLETSDADRASPGV